MVLIIAMAVRLLLAPSNQFVMQPNQAAELVVPLTYQKDGVTSSNPISLPKVNILSTSAITSPITVRSPGKGQMYAQLKRDNSEDPGKR